MTGLCVGCNKEIPTVKSSKKLSRHISAFQPLPSCPHRFKVLYAIVDTVPARNRCCVVAFYRYHRESSAFKSPKECIQHVQASHQSPTPLPMPMLI